MTSLRRTALVWMTVLLAVAGGCAFLISYELARREADDFLDGQLRQIALNVGEGVSQATAPAVAQDPEDEFAISIWARSGELVRQSPDGVSLPRQPRPGFSTVVHNGRGWRIFVASDGHRTVQIGQRLEVREEVAATAAVQSSAPILIVIPVFWLLISWALGRMTGRLARLADKIASRSVDRRDHVPVDEAPVEVRPIIIAMNALADRLQHALDQQKRLVSDAAHELRTPLTALRLQFDNLRASATADQAALICALDGGLRRANALVQQLLRLARSEETGARQEMIDLSALVAECVADFVPIAETKGLDVGLSAPEPIAICGAAAELKLLFGNLIDNAVRYAAAGGTVDVNVRRTRGGFAVEVLDTGRGVPEADIPRLFDRFFRAASVDVEGSGLGLSIAAAVAKSHRFVIDIENRRDRQGLRVCVTGSAGRRPLIHS